MGELIYMDAEAVAALTPPHEVRDFDKLDTLIESMQQEGWKGRPLLFAEENPHRLLTGSHRYAAIQGIIDYADETGDDSSPIFETGIPVLVEDFGDTLQDWDDAELFDWDLFFVHGDDDDKANHLADIEYPEDDVIELLQAEVGAQDD